MTKTQDKDRRIKIFTSHFIARVRKGCSRFACERELETEHKLQYFDPKVMADSVVSFSFSRAAQPEPWGPLCWVICYILSATSQVPKLHRGSRGPSQPDVAFPTTSPSDLQLNFTWTRTQLARRTQLSYIIVRRPLDLWNQMFNRHQAEITFMQFRGHSLPVHHSVVA